MRTSLLASLAALFLLSAGCSTTASLISGTDDAWVNFKDDKNGTLQVLFCSANRNQKGQVNPACYAPLLVREGLSEQVGPHGAAPSVSVVDPEPPRKMERIKR